MTEPTPQKPKPQKPKTRLVAVIGIDSRGKRYEPGDEVTLPDKIAQDYLTRGKVRKERA